MPTLRINPNLILLQNERHSNQHHNHAFLYLHATEYHHIYNFIIQNFLNGNNRRTHLAPYFRKNR